jgi:hypothetical protein
MNSQIKTALTPVTLNCIINNIQNSILQQSGAIVEEHLSNSSNKNAEELDFFISPNPTLQILFP